MIVLIARLTVGISALFLVFLLIGCNAEQNAEIAEDGNSEEAIIEEQNNESNDAADEIKIMKIEAVEEHWMYNDDLMSMAWTYNGKVPGEEIRVREGENVEIHFKNSLPFPTALHLHGLPITNEMDGVPGITQNTVLPGEEFIYSFKADTPGTYWYHSHENSAQQLFKGLYGAIIVEPSDQEEFNLDQMVIINEWSTMESEIVGNMSEMDHGAMNQDMTHGHGGHGDTSAQMAGESHNEMMNEMYDTLIINGKADPAFDIINVKEGDKAKLRFLNAGLYTQVISIPEHSFKVTHYDGQPVNEPELIKNKALRIAPGERYDVELTLDNPGAWGIHVFAEENRDKLNGLIPVVYEGFESESLVSSDDIVDYFDFTSYGTSIAHSLDGSEITKEYDMILDSNDGGETFTINGKKSPEHEVYHVESGDIVKMTITNNSDVDHPMHSHGHLFSVISKDGQPIEGSPIIKDTLNVRPNETYEIVFVADNEGNWVFHCHELHHASSGMISEIKYEGFEPNF
ncbi:multicopper oxidase family protein [Anaerobacillus sp. MEB173]|uniref:multicopper oxidase family protein n=1 Tax=Anaerobacillus sp. MEB173 TaxID=3383345 RepID=UPI003F90E54F